MLRRALILFGLLAFAFSSSGAALSLHRLIEHGGVAAECAAPGEPSASCDDNSPEPSNEREPKDDQDCSLCTHLSGARDVLEPAEVPGVVVEARSAPAMPGRSQAFVARDVCPASPPRGPPFFA